MLKRFIVPVSLLASAATCDPPTMRLNYSAAPDLHFRWSPDGQLLTTPGAEAAFRVGIGSAVMPDVDIPANWLESLRIDVIRGCDALPGVQPDGTGRSDFERELRDRQAGATIELSESTRDPRADPWAGVSRDVDVRVSEPGRYLFVVRYQPGRSTLLDTYMVPSVINFGGFPPQTSCFEVVAMLSPEQDARRLKTLAGHVDQSEAVALMRRAHLLYPDSPVLEAEVGLWLEAAGHTEEARAHLAHALSRYDPQLADPFADMNTEQLIAGARERLEAMGPPTD
jgi:hypothetical protein